jgi:uncharacterized protein YcfL
MIAMKRIRAVLVAALMLVTGCMSNAPQPVLQEAAVKCTRLSSTCSEEVSCLRSEAASRSYSMSDLSPSTR